MLEEPDNIDRIKSEIELLIFKIPQNFAMRPFEANRGAASGYGFLFYHGLLQISQATHGSINIIGLLQH